MKEPLAHLTQPFPDDSVVQGFIRTSFVGAVLRFCVLVIDPRQMTVRERHEHVPPVRRQYSALEQPPG